MFPSPFKSSGTIFLIRKKKNIKRENDLNSQPVASSVTKGCLLFFFFKFGNEQTKFLSRTPSKTPEVAHNTQNDLGC